MIDRGTLTADPEMAVRLRANALAARKLEAERKVMSRNRECFCGCGRKAKRCGAWVVQEILSRNPNARVDWEPEYFKELA